MCAFGAATLAAGAAAAPPSFGSALAISSPVMPPHTRHSAVEFEPSRLAPCSETHAASPAAQIPSTRVLPLMSVSMPPIE